ncbi:Tyrosine kinase SYK [Ceratobasidium sp. AG-Ba]|nr:Tyrosine kinase SYK [Ceratobasidium sp. AG-Ba]QRW10792.1 Tyrosine kinase SYK [Ceratobasidium sp. AG-Ba]
MAEAASFSEDWDRPATPPPKNMPLDECTTSPGGTTRGSRSLSDLMRLHAEHGKENLQLNPQEESRLEEELAKWVNSEEDDDTFFGRRSLDGGVRPRVTDLGRPRGQSESHVREGSHERSGSPLDRRERKDSSKMLIPGRGVIAGSANRD